MTDFHLVGNNGEQCIFIIDGGACEIRKSTDNFAPARVMSLDEGRAAWRSMTGAGGWEVLDPDTLGAELRARITRVRLNLSREQAQDIVNMGAQRGRAENPVLWGYDLHQLAQSAARIVARANETDEGREAGRLL